MVFPKRRPACVRNAGVRLNKPRRPDSATKLSRNRPKAHSAPRSGVGGSPHRTDVIQGLRPAQGRRCVAHVAARAPAKHPTNCHVAVVCVPGMGPDGSMRAWRRGSTVAASVLLLSSCGLSFVPPAPAVGNTCVQRTYWTPQCATSAPQGEKGGGVAGHRLMLPAVFRHCLPYWPTYIAPSHV
jgi:hypothetical protein